MPAILNQGQTKIRDAFKTLVTHVTISDDTTAWGAAHTGINPGAAATSTWVKAATEANVDFQTADYTMSIDGDTEFTGKVINCIGVADGVGVRSATGAGGTHGGGSVVGTATISRTLRTAGLGWGIQAGDIATVGVRGRHEDNSV